jgi:hypothetical protein
VGRGFCYPLPMRFRLTAVSTDGTGRALGPALATFVPPETQLDIGREGDLPLGVEPEDDAVSRRAVTVQASELGWDVSIGNRNGAVLQPWGSRAQYVASGTTGLKLSGLVAVRVLGTTADAPNHHWVLLESDGAQSPRASTMDAMVTRANEPPGPLTTAQREAVLLTFAEHLAWPPRAAPLAATLDVVARRLGKSSAAVIQRLEGARKKAYQLGMAQQYGVTEPEYVHVLVSNGYLDPPTTWVEAEELDLFPG